MDVLVDLHSAISNLRISAVPNLAAPPPVFLPRRQQQQRDAPAGAKQPPPKGKQQQQQGGKAKGKPQTKATPKQPRPRQHVSAAASRAAAADSRVQDDSLYGEFEAELLCEELLNKQTAPATVSA